MSYSDDEEDEKDIEAALEAKKAARKTKTPKVRPCTLDKPTQDLIRLIFDNDMFKEQLQTFNIDVKKMPLGEFTFVPSLSCDQEKSARIRLPKVLRCWRN